jgi:phosphohistidine phosphatase SixA
VTDRFTMHRVLTVLLLAPILGCGSPLVSEPVSQPVSESAAPRFKTANPIPSPSGSANLWSQLQQAERPYVVLLRHALAPGVGDPAQFRLDDCSTQRNLSAAGQEQARQIGAAFRQRQVPVMQVLSSQWCRCLETAELLNLGTVQPLPVLNSFFNERSSGAAQTNQLRQWMGQQDRPGVIVMVTHQVNITAVTDIVPQSGEAIVLQVNAPEQIEVMGSLELEQL